MMKKWYDLISRSLTAIIGGLVFVFLLTFSIHTAILLFFVLSVFCFREVIRMCVGFKKTRQNNYFYTFCLISFWLIFLGNFFKYFAYDYAISAWLSLAFLMMLNELSSKDFSIQKNFTIGFSILFATPPFFILIHSTEDFNYRFSDLLLLFCLLIWSADIGGYFFGRTFGKHKIIPSVSPGKSWEGLIGGIIVSNIVFFVFVEFKNINHTFLSFTIPMVTTVVGFMGDIFISRIKRQFNLKDTGRLLPGHGGFLDRFDAFIFAAPFYGVIVNLFIF